MTTAVLSPFPKFRAFDSNGDPLVGGKLYTFAAGTTTPLASYVDQAGVTANANPVILDANGEADVWIKDASYKFLLQDSNSVQQWVVDNIYPSNEISAFNSSVTFNAAVILNDILTVNSEFILKELASPATPASGYGKLNLGTDKILRLLDSNGLFTRLGDNSTQNLGVTYNSGTGVFKITSASGAALSTTNYGIVKIQSATSGLVEYVRITSDVSFVDDNGASDILGEEFGTVAGTARTTDKAFYIYCTKDASNNAAFFISPRPNMTVVPALASVGWKANPSPTPSDNSAWFILSSSPSAAYSARPCTRVGGFPMRKSSADDWTVQALTSAHGIMTVPFAGSALEHPAGMRTDFTIPSSQGFGTPTTTIGKYSLANKILSLEVLMASGTPTAVEARVGLPNGFVSAYEQNSAGSFGVNSGIDVDKSFVRAPSGANYVVFGSFTSGFTINSNGTQLLSSAGQFLTFNATLEITEWS